MLSTLGFVVLVTALGAAGAFSASPPPKPTAAKPAPANPPAAKSAPAKSTAAKPAPPARRVIAYYFHTTYRCASCRAIEAYSAEAIKAAFAKQLESGQLVWSPVNIDEKEHRHFIKDYELFTKSLVLVDEARGRTTRWKNLVKVWELLGDKPAFLKYVQAEVSGYLKERT
jgi:hypothetical protein